MKNKRIRYFFSFIVLILLLWLSAPFWSKFALQAFLPDGWKVSTLKMSIPGLSSVKVAKLQITLADGKQLAVSNVKLPYFYKNKTIAIDRILFTLPHDELKPKSNHIHPQNPFKLTSIAPMELPFSLNVKRAIIRSSHFSIQGELKLNPRALSFEGKGLWHKISQAVEFYLSGMDGRSDLNLAIALGKQQHFSLNYAWSPSNRPQQLHLSANVKARFLQLLKNIQLLPANLFSFSKPELALSIDLNWPEFPEDITHLLQVKVRGEAELNFDKFSTQKLTLDQNSFQANFNNKQISFKAGRPISITALLQKQPLHITTNDRAVELTIDPQNTIHLLKSPIFRFKWQGQIIEYKNRELLFDNNKLMLSGKGLIKGKLDPQKLLQKNKDIILGKYELNSNLDFTLAQNRLSLQIPGMSLTQTSKALLAASSSNEINLNLQNLYLTNNPLKLTIHLDQPNVVGALLKQLNTSGKVHFLTALNDLTIKTLCKYQLDASKAGIQCKMAPNNLIAKNKKNLSQKMETIYLDAGYHIKTSQLSTQLKTNSLTSSFWSVSNIYPAIKDEQWALHFNLNSTINLNIVPSELKPVINSLTPNSNIVLDAKTISVFDYQFTNMHFDLKKLSSDQIESKIDLDSIHQNQGVTLNDLKTEISLSDLKRLNARASFKLFSGRFDVSIPETSIHQPTKNLKINVTHLDLGSFFKFMDIKGFAASGRIDGFLPVAVNNKGILVKNGELHSTSTGVLKYISPNDTTPFEQQNIAMQALQDFQYEKLTISIEQLNFYFKQPGHYKFPMRIIGRNPKLLMGKSIALNPVLQGQIPKQAWRYFISKDIKQVVSDKLKK